MSQETTESIKGETEEHLREYESNDPEYAERIKAALKISKHYTTICLPRRSGRRRSDRTSRSISSSISNIPLILLIQLILPKSGPRFWQY